MVLGIVINGPIYYNLKFPSKISFSKNVLICGFGRCIKFRLYINLIFNNDKFNSFTNNILIFFIIMLLLIHQLINHLLINIQIFFLLQVHSFILYYLSYNL